MTELYNPEELTLNHRRERLVLNLKLVKKNRPNVLKLLMLHNERFDLYDAVELGQVDPGYAVGELRRIETALQVTWGFKPDVGTHVYWCDLPGCLCDSLDNRDPTMPGLLRRYNGRCVFHGADANINPWR